MIKFLFHNTKIQQTLSKGPFKNINFNFCV
jgi:hypothetical protein